MAAILSRPQCFNYGWMLTFSPPLWESSPPWHKTIHFQQSQVCSLPKALRWRHHGRDSVSNHQSHDCLLNLLFRRRSKKTSKLRVTGLCAWNSPGTGEFPAQRASYAENVSIWWRHHGNSEHNQSFAFYNPLQNLFHVTFVLSTYSHRYKSSAYFKSNYSFPSTCNHILYNLKSRALYFASRWEPGLH